MQRFTAKVRWLFTKEGWPSLLVIALGFLIGVFIDGAVGIILATIVGLALLTLLKRFHLPTKPWQATVGTIMPIIARLCFMMILLLPVADVTVGLLLPSGHNPDTFMKYLSIMVVVPKNIISNAPVGDIFPGIPIVVALSIVLMFLGSLNLYKRKYLIMAFIGLIIYTISPSIASVVTPAVFSPVSSYAIGYYLGWIGLILVIVDKFLLHRILKTPAPSQPSPTLQRANHLMSIIPFVGIALFFTPLQSLHINLSIITLQDLSSGFEAAHHAVAGVLSGAVAGVGAGSVIDSVSSSGDPGNNPPDSPTVPVPPPDVPSTAPPTQEPPDIDEINNAKKQREIDEQYMSAFEKDRQKQINDDKIKAANDDKVLQEIRDHAQDDTKKFYKDFYEQENEFNSWEAEHELKNAENMETLEHAAEYTKKGADWAIWIGKYTVPGGKQVADAYEVASNFAEGASEAD